MNIVRKSSSFLFFFVFLLTACTAGASTPTQADLYATALPSGSPTVTAAGTVDVVPTAAETPQVLPSPIPTQAENTPASAMVCTMVSARPTPGATQESLFPPVSEADWTKGPPEAPITLLEYSDFQCPSCAGLAEILDRILEENPEDVRVAFRHFPLLSIHANAAVAMQAAEAAGRQDKFWEMHDLLFARQEEWSPLEADAFEAWLQERVVDLDLDVDQFTADLESDELKMQAQEAWDWGVATRISYTPFLLFNGEIYDGPVSYSQLNNVIKLHLLEQRQFTYCPEMLISPGKEYFATIRTELGDIVLRLFPEAAPKAVNSFVFLARQGWFDGITFHRVLPGFMAQGGDPSGTGFGGPGYAFAIEVDSGLQFDRAGLLAMANSGPESNGSQFFITTGAAPHLNGGFTIFGEVLEGQEIVDSLSPRNPSPGLLLPPGDLILEVTIDER